MGPNDGPIAQLAEHSADNAGVRGAIPLWPTILLVRQTARRTKKLHQQFFGPVAQLVEHLLCKQGVSGSSPLRSMSSMDRNFFRSGGIAL